MVVLRTITFTMEDALLTPESLTVLAGANMSESTEEKPMYVHATSQVQVDENNTIVMKVDDIEDALKIVWNGGRTGDKNNIHPQAVREDHYYGEADIFCMKLDPETGDFIDEPCVPSKIEIDNDKVVITCHAAEANGVVLVDYYVKKTSGVQQIEISPDVFSCNFYIEGDTLFRQQGTGVDFPAEIVIPDGKVQSNFSLAMTPNGDPSTFTFTVDAFPGYTKFDKTKKVFADIQIVNPDSDEEEDYRMNCLPISAYDDNVKIKVTKNSADNAEIELSGNLIEDKYSESLFGKLTEHATQIDIAMPVDGADTYRIVQTNPALEYYDGMENISQDGTNWIKNKTYELEKDSDELEYAFLASTKSGSIKIEFYKGSDLVKTYNIVNNITFTAV